MRRKKSGPAALAGAIRAGGILLTGGIEPRNHIAGSRQAQASRWLVPGWLPAGTVTFLHSADERDGRTLGLQLCLCFAAGQSFLGHAMPSGPNAALFLSSAARPLDLKRASTAIERELALPRAALSGMLFCPSNGSDRVLAKPDPATGDLKPTVIFNELLETVDEKRPGVIVLESLIDLFHGDHFDHQHTRAFMTLMDRLCSISGATMLLLAPADFEA